MKTIKPFLLALLLFCFVGPAYAFPPTPPFGAASPGDIGGTTPGAGTFTTLIADDLGQNLDANSFLIYDSTDALELGTAAASGHSLGTGDVIVGGQLEVDSYSFFDQSAYFTSGTVYFQGSSAIWSDNVPGAFGSSAMNVMWDTNAANDDFGVLRFIESNGADIPGIITSDFSYSPNGDATWDDITEPFHGFMDDDADSNFRIGFLADDSPGIDTDGDTFVINDPVSIENVLYLKEITTPTPVAGYGAFYSKADDLPYFQDGSGAEHKLSETDTEYGEMYLNANAVATTIETAATPIAIRLFTTGSLNDWTFDAGSTAAITAYADYSGTVAGTVLATSTHGLTTLDVVSIRGTTNYNGIFQVTVVDSTHFYFTDTWAADDGASDFDEPSHLIAGANAAGEYSVAWDMSSLAGTGNDTFLFVVYTNTTAHASTRVDRKFANNDIGAFGGCGIMTIAVGDWVFLTAENDGTGTITNAYGALVIARL